MKTTPARRQPGSATASLGRAFSIRAASATISACARRTERRRAALHEVAVRLYELKVWPRDQDGVWRAIDVTDRQSLHHLHETI